MTPRQMIETLRTAEALAARQPRARVFVLEFTASLERQAAEGKTLSAKQIALLKKLYGETVTPAPQPEKVDVGGAGIDGIRALFDKAAQKLQRPAITVTCDGIELELSRAPDHGSNPGFIYARADGAYIGKIDRAGAFNPDRRTPPPAEAVTALRTFGSDPAGIGAKSGHLTGRCAFCRIKLSDKRSTDVGYGKKCSENWGLPWGEIANEQPKPRARKTPVSAPAQAWERSAAATPQSQQAAR